MNRRILVGAVVLMVALSLLVVHRSTTTTPDPFSPIARRDIAAPVITEALPAAVVVVSPHGHDGGPGTEEAPLRTIQSALTGATPGQTIALRGGVYRESVTIRTPDLTLRAWPGERVWLDGTVEGDGFIPDGQSWRLDDFRVDLDTSPTFTRGAPDNTEQGFQFLADERPLAADPQQVWLDDTPLRQVATRSALGPGTFLVDRDHRQLFVGSDPTGHRMQAGVLPKAITVDAPRVRLAGLGIRRYVPSVPDFGAVTIAGVGSHISDVLVTDSATIGMSVQASDVTLTRVQLDQCGLLGLHANEADRLKLLSVRATANNTQGFNMSPTAGGAKLTRVRGLLVDGGQFANNAGNGLWLDESVVDSQITLMDATDNQSHGLQIELSSGIDVVAVATLRNRRSGVCIQNSDRVRIWNTAALGNARQINFVQDGRRPTDSDAPKLWPGESGTPGWVIGNSEVVNSVLGDGRDHNPGDTLFAVQDFTRGLNASALRIRLRHNLYLHPADGIEWTHVWTRAHDDPDVYQSLGAFQEATGQDHGSRELPSTTPPEELPVHPEPLPSELSALVGGGLHSIGPGRPLP